MRRRLVLLLCVPVLASAAIAALTHRGTASTFHPADPREGAPGDSRSPSASDHRATLPSTSSGQVALSPSAALAFLRRPPRVAPRTEDGVETLGSRAECLACLSATCAAEVANGGDLESARCLVPCIRNASEGACKPEQRVIDPRIGSRVLVCPGASRSAETMALARCGLVCACPDGLGDDDTRPPNLR
jgi:hypothetical protein